MRWGTKFEQVAMAHDYQNARYDGSPSILIATDTTEGGAKSKALVSDTFGWPARVVGIEEAVARLDEAVSTGAVLVDVRHDPGETLDRLLDRLDLAARQDRHGSVVVTAEDLIDIAAARAPHANVRLLVEPTDFERAVELVVAARSRPLPTSIAEEGGAPGQLLQLSEEASRIARALAAMSGITDQRATAAPPGRQTAAAEPPNAASVRAIIRARRLRDQFLDGALFADPAWDMLLDLMAARLEGRPVAVSSLCIAAAVPPTTALRWMKQLTDEGLFVRVADPRDGRRVFIELSDTAAAGLSAYFQALARTGVALP